MKGLFMIACVAAAACAPGWYGGAAPASAGATQDESASLRRIRFNGRPLGDADARVLAALERLGGGPLPDGDYWYDALSGAWGQWGGPGLGLTRAGLGLGGPLPASASGGGDGRWTGVFVNGRELHPIDVQRLVLMYGSVIPGRYWVDANLNFGFEGGPPIGNLAAMAGQGGATGAGGGGTTTYTPGPGGSTGSSVQTGPNGCVITPTYVGSGC